MYSDQVLDDVRSANNIIEVVSARVTLAKKGKYFFGLCPFHNEKTPSFSVDPDRQMYYCYSCNKGGDAFKFIMETEKLTFPEAIQRLAERAHIQLPESSDPVYNNKLARAKQLKERFLEMHTLATGFYSQALMSDAGTAARAYMRKRAIRMDMVRRFSLGYAPAEWGALLGFLRSKGFNDEEITQGGLVASNGGNIYDRFRDRVMFPIQDASGHVIAFGGRALDDSEVKYLNSPETPLYSKGKHLYGLNHAKNTKEKFMLIVEGYMDLISLSARGVDNAVATLGTALTEAQARLLKRYTADVVISFDADTAGQNAALRGMDILENEGFRVRVLTVPEGKDPDDFVKARGAAAFRELITGAEPLIEYKISRLRQSRADAGIDGDALFLKDAVQVLANVKNAVERELYAGRIASQYGISEASIKQEIEKALAPSQNAARGRYGSAYGGRRSGREGATGASAADAGLNRTNASPNRTGRGKNAAGDPQGSFVDELFVLALLSVDNALWDVVAGSLPPDIIENANTRQAVKYACERASSGYTVLPGELMHFFQPEESDGFAKILTEACHCEDNRRAIEQKIKDIYAARARRHVRGILRALEDEDLPEADAADLRAQLTEHMKQAK